MTKFIDGPAAGITLSLRRAPVFLRVVRSNRGNWDALDQLNDLPKATEMIWVYVQAERPGYMHLLCRPRSAGGFFATGNYKLLSIQPDDAQVRDTQAWQSWCLQHRDLAPCWKGAAEDAP